MSCTPPKQFRLLIIDLHNQGDTDCNWPTNTEVVRATSLEQAYSLLLPEFGMTHKQARQKVKTPNVAHSMAFADYRRKVDQLVLESRKPYWDAVLSDLFVTTQDVPHPIGLAAAGLVTACGVRYVGLKSQIEVAGINCRALFRHNTSCTAILSVNGVQVWADNRTGSDEFSWQRLLINTILLAKEQNPFGYGFVNLDNVKRDPQEEILNLAWPGLLCERKEDD